MGDCLVSARLCLCLSLCRRITRHLWCVLWPAEHWASTNITLTWNEKDSKASEPHPATKRGHFVYFFLLLLFLPRLLGVILKRHSKPWNISQTFFLWERWDAEAAEQLCLVRLWKPVLSPQPFPRLMFSRTYPLCYMANTPERERQRHTESERITIDSVSEGGENTILIPQPRAT